jgi:hypothetical protein
MKQVSRMTQGEFGAFIQSHLREKGIEVILSGGAAVAICTISGYDIFKKQPHFYATLMIRNRNDYPKY